MTTSDKQEKNLQVAKAQDVVGEGELNSEQILERTILFALDEAAEQLKQRGGVEPFTVLIKGEELFVEEHSSVSEEKSYAEARRSIFQMEKLCNAYVFCYDGFVDLDSGTSDALITEFAQKGDEKAQIIVRLYNKDAVSFEIEETLYHVGKTDSLFSRALSEVEKGDEAKESEESDEVSDTQEASNANN